MAKLPPAAEEIRQILRGVIDPELGSDIVELGMVRAVAVEDDGRAVITIALTTAGCPLRAQIQRDIKSRVSPVPGVSDVRLVWDAMTEEERAAAMAKARWNVAQQPEETSVPLSAKVILISSGKGGVGKSSVSVNLAAALAARGLKIGLVDADIWGFSVPRMLGVEGRMEGVTRDGKRYMLPHERTIGQGTVRVVSMGFLVDGEQTALMWRGLMLNRGVQHFLQDVAWGDDLDYLIVDMPPGTGDVQMGVARLLPRAEVVVVTTPALAAQQVATRAVSMARKSYLRVAGVIENMTSFRDPQGVEHALFGTGGGETLANDAGVPLLARIPIEPAVSAGSDAGSPVALADGPSGEAFRDLADRIVSEAVPPSDMAGCSARMLNAAVAALDAADV